MAVFTLTPGTDTFTGTSADETVNGDATTLTPGDSLDGGAGHDVLQLFGGGLFDLSALGLFTGFEEVNVTNVTGGTSDLTLGNGVDLTVTVDNGTTRGGGTIQLADGATTLNLGWNFQVLASTGAATIDVIGSDNKIFLSTGTANIHAASGGNQYFVSSGLATIDLTEAP